MSHATHAARPNHARRRTSTLEFLVLCVLGGSGCGPSPGPSLPEPVPPVIKSASAVGLSLSLLDETIDPCVDLYRYACGNWPPNGALFADRFEEATQTLEAIKTTQLRTSGTPANQLLEQCREETDEQRLAALEPIDARIDSIRNRRDHARVVAELDQIGAGGYFEISMGRETPPHSEWLLVLKPRSPSGDATQEAIATSLKRFEPDPAQLQERARAVAEMITKVEAASGDDGILRIDRAGLGGLAPAFEWDSYLAAMGTQPFGVGTTAPSYIERFGKLTAKTPLAVLRDHLRWSLSDRTRQFWEPTNRIAACEKLIRQEFPERLAVRQSRQTIEAVETVLTRVQTAIESTAASRDWRIPSPSTSPSTSPTAAKFPRSSIRISVDAGPLTDESKPTPRGDAGFLASVFASRKAAQATWFPDEQSSSSAGGVFAEPSEIHVGPATIVSPLFDVGASASINLGRMTATVGPIILELLVSELPADDREALDARGQCLAPLEGDARTNAVATIGALSFVASNHAAKRPTIRTPAHSADQLFFLGFAQASCSKQGGANVNRAVANVKEFSAAFECPAASPMNPVERCSAW